MADAQVTPSLSDYADQLIKEKNFTTLTPEVFTQVKADVLERLNDFLIAKVIEKLSDTQVSEFNAMLEKSPSDEEIQSFIQAALPDPATTIGDILLAFRKMYLGLE